MKLEEYNFKEKQLIPKGYLHFDSKNSLKRLWNYVSSREKVKCHSFYPFIKDEIKYSKFNKKKWIEDCIGIEKKTRSIMYCSHTDRYIYQLYNYKLSTLYEDYIKEIGIDNNVIAYRKIDGKCNIHFAKQAFDFIKEKDKCEIIVGDFTSFFDNLQHDYLKKMILKVMNVEYIEDDFYAVFKNITKYSYCEKKDLLLLNGVKSEEELRGISKVILEKRLYKKNKKKIVKMNRKRKGIPQGSPISALLSNVYMIEFDKALSLFAKEKNGLYLRYSDDFIIIIPSEEKTCETVNEEVQKKVNMVPSLTLEPKKTKRYKFECESIKNHDGDDVRLDYLGFTFDGKYVRFRDKTITKYFYKVYRKIKTIKRRNGISPKGNVISCEELYNKYTTRIHGKMNVNSNFLTYVLNCEKVFKDEKYIHAFRKKHLLKIRRRLNG